MKTLLHPLFLLSVLLFLLNQLLEYMQIYVWPLNTYLDDFLCLPITLTLILAVERTYFNNPNFKLPLSYLITTVLLYSLLFEGILPLFSEKYTADILDVVAYIVGAILFQITVNRSSTQGYKA